MGTVPGIHLLENLVDKKAEFDDYGAGEVGDEWGGEEEILTFHPVGTMPRKQPFHQRVGHGF